MDAMSASHPAFRAIGAALQEVIFKSLPIHELVGPYQTLGRGSYPFWNSP
jgi:hypothetical protein